MTTPESHIDLNYRKIRPLDLDALAKQYEPSEDDIANNYNPFAVSEIQSFSPLYSDFFQLNESNYNRIGLNHRHYLEGSAVKPNDTTDDEIKYHVKCSPLLDPIHYLVGKYHNSKNIRTLPTLTNQSECFAKLANKQNASYVDGFFSYLGSQLKHKHNMLNAVDFYGSYLAVQKVFKATVTDDLDYLHQSSYFMDHIGKGVNICCANSEGGGLFDDFTGIGSRANKKRLVLEDELDASELEINVVEQEESVLPNTADIQLESDALCEYKKGDDSSSSSSESSSESSGSSCSEEEDENDNREDEDDHQSSENSSTESSETEAYAYIDNFPANLIFLEKCDGTLDSLFMNQEIDEETGAACLMQVIMSLIAMQKAFQFTHNDLHTNNIMYVNTDVEFLYYKYDNRFYRVPTHGKIFKIIDFGRAIYRFKNQIYCSDSFAPKGDAHSQYNTEPYFNSKKPRVEANPSFDLCRLGTSIYDFIIQDEDEPRDDFQETIYRWCHDDSGKNIMYRRDGEERYPGFKLYKIIARNVHAHTPQNQLEYPIFAQFVVEPGNAMTIDEQEVRRNGLNIDLIEREYIISTNESR
jgi:hypothetical protein